MKCKNQILTSNEDVGDKIIVLTKMGNFQAILNLYSLNVGW